MNEAGTLLIFKLSVQSSYSEDFEREATDKFDTIQWWIGSSGTWRIKTYAVDSDIHPYHIETKKSKEALIELAKANTKKTYGDVISQVLRIEIPEGWNEQKITALLAQNRLNQNFEWVEAGYLLWLPGDSTFTTKTTPQEH